MPDANSRQVGGTHYKAAIEHWDFVEINQLGYLEGCATKYMTRSRKKGGHQDLQKALHYIEKIRDLHQRGLKRPPRDLQLISVDDFAWANGLSTLERDAVNVLATWKDDADLQLAHHLTEELLKTAV